MFKPDALWSTCMLPSKLKFVRNPGRSERDTLKSKDSPSLHSGPAYDVMLQSQVKPSHCCKQTPWFEQESSWHVVLGPAVRDVSGSEGAKVRKKDTQTHFLLLVFSLEPSVSQQFGSCYFLRAHFLETFLKWPGWLLCCDGVMISGISKKKNCEI